MAPNEMNRPTWGPLSPFPPILRRVAEGTEEPLVLVRDLVAAFRPRSRNDGDNMLRRWRELLALLQERADYRRALAGSLFKMLAERDQRSFYTETGLLPNTGFFSELRQLLARKILPSPIDTSNFLDCLRFVFTGAGVIHWLVAIPQEERDAYWHLLADEGIGSPEERFRVREQVLDAAIIIGHRVAAMGLEPELLRIVPRLNRGESPFIALCNDVTRTARLLRDSGPQARVRESDARHFDVLLDQCREAVLRAHQAAATRGTSFPLTFLLVRLQQHLERLELLLGLVGEQSDPDDRFAAAHSWRALIEQAIVTELQRNRIFRHAANLTALISLRVTENAGQTGEHYIATDRAEWLGIWRAATSAGLLIALMALIKLLGSSLHLAVLSQGLLNGGIYAGGFVIIHLCHGIIATKQPAMTAATIAATVSQTRGGLREIDRLAELVVATARSQFAAITGNVLVALPLAMAVGLTIHLYRGAPMIPPAKATALLKEIEPLGGAPFFAAIAGIWLFMAGLVSGLIDNQVAYGQVGERVACHPRLTRLMGRERAARLGAYLDHNAGGLAGNVFFGMMLGLTQAFGLATGLPLDIRHIAFSAANLGYSLTALGFRVEPLVMLRGVAGVALIGAINLAVSFSLALWVALRSRNVDFTAAAALLPELKRRLFTKPSRFFVPPDR